MSEKSKEVPHVESSLYDQSPEIMDSEQRIKTALFVAAELGAAESEHGKAYAIDQMVRVLTGCPLIVLEPTAFTETPYTYDGLGESEAYIQFVRDFEAEVEDQFPLEWDSGQPD